MDNELPNNEFKELQINRLASQYKMANACLYKLVSKAHAIDREFRFMDALGKTNFPVPKTFCYCTYTCVMGAEFYIMEYIEGRVFEDFTLPSINPSDRKAIYGSMNETLAHLHSINPDTIAGWVILSMKVQTNSMK